MKIEVDEQPGGEWDEYVASRPDAGLGHAGAWARVLRNAYGLATCFLAARSSSGDVEGVLPLAEVKGLRGGRELVSLPYLDAAGVLASTPDAADALVARALEIARERGATAVELRCAGGSSETVGAEGDAPGVDRVDLVLRLEGDEDAQWKAVRAKVRNQTRKAEREGLEILPLTGDALLDAYYDPFRVNMRDLGSPVHSRRFFAAIVEGFGDRARLIVTGLAGRPVGGLVAIRFAQTVTVPWASTLRSERKRCPNNQIYWEALRWAVRGGAAEFDFGRSPRDAGTYRFKVGWGATERPLDWRRLDPSGAPLPIELPGASPMLRRLSALWTRLPVPVATWLGPHLRRRISS